MNIAITGSGSKTEYSDTLDWQIEAWVSTYTPLPKANSLPFQTICRSCWDAHRLILKM